MVGLGCRIACRESLRDVEACLRAQRSKLYHMGIGSQVSRSTMAIRMRTRDWRIYALELCPSH